jgi:hypothetical protein
MRLITIVGVGVFLLGGTASAEQDPRQSTVKRTGLQVDLGALAMRSVADNDGPGMRTAYLGSVGAQLAITERIAVGAALLFGGEQQIMQCFCAGAQDDRSAFAFGGHAFASLRVPLAGGVQLRPAAGVGMMRGTHAVIAPADGTMVIDQRAVFARIAVPIAYLPVPELVLHAGPELNLLAGSSDVDDFTQVTLGLGVGAGYAF